MSAPYVSVFDRAKFGRDAKDVGDILDAPASTRWKRLKVCPFCEGRDDFSYRVDGYHCFKCGERGSVVDLAAHLWSLSPFEAACALIGADVETERRAYAAAHGGNSPPSLERRMPKPKAVVRASYGDDGVEAVIAEVRRRMRRASQTLVERYLESRGLPASFERYVHFCPDAPYDVSASWGRGRRFPAMVCVVEVDGVPTGGLHLTYLRADGRGKVDTLRPREPKKKMWGPQLNSRGVPGGIVLIRPESEVSVMCVAEGIENALSLARVVGNGCGAFAAGSLNRFQGGMAQTSWGAIDWRSPAPDPDKPAATFRHKGPALLAVDSDMQPLVVGKGQWERTITPERRAQISGVLASHWWQRAGASDVRCITPALGKDLNDCLMEQAA
ncbi:MAG: hypothetical protein ACK4X1_16370 [Terricaulis sp.]